MAAACAFFLLGIIACPASLIRFDFTGDDPSFSQPWPEYTFMDPKVTTTGVGLGAGVVSATGDNRFNVKSWSLGSSLSTAIDGNKYISFDVVPESGYALNLGLSTLDFTLQAAATGPNQFALMSSIDGFTASSLSLLSGSISGTMNFEYTFPETGYDGMADPVEFRLYGWGASGSSGTMSVNALEVGGAVAPVVAPVPEPGACGMLSGLFLLGLFALQSFRRRT